MSLLTVKVVNTFVLTASLVAGSVVLGTSRVEAQGDGADPFQYLLNHFAALDRVDPGACGIKEGGFLAEHAKVSVPANSHGDVHIFTPDGLAFDYQDSGEFTLLASSDNAVLIHTRQSLHDKNPQVSINTAVGLWVAGDSLEFYSDKSGHRLYVNGERRELPVERLSLPRGGVILLDKKGPQGPHYFVTWPTADYVARVNLNYQYLDVGFTQDARHQVSFAGLIGNLDGNPLNDMLPRDGSELICPPANAESLALFGESWRLSAQETLLRSELDDRLLTMLVDPFTNAYVHPESAVGLVLEQNAADATIDNQVDLGIIVELVLGFYDGIDEASVRQILDELFGGGQGEWVLCAREDEQCDFNGVKTVRYGENGTFASGEFEDGVGCNNSVFGDPLYGVVKSCYYLEGGTGSGEGGRVALERVNQVIGELKKNKQPHVLENLDLVLRARGQQSCQNEGLTDLLALANCILDVGATGEDNFAGGALVVEGDLRKVPDERRFAGSTIGNITGPDILLPDEDIERLVTQQPGSQGGGGVNSDGLELDQLSDQPMISAACLDGEQIALSGISVGENGLLQLAEGPSDFHYLCENIAINSRDDGIYLSASCANSNDDFVESSLSLMDAPAMAPFLNNAACQPQSTTTVTSTTGTGGTSDTNVRNTGIECKPLLEGSETTVDLAKELEGLTGVPHMALFCAIHERGQSWASFGGFTAEEAQANARAGCEQLANQSIDDKGNIVEPCALWGTAEREFNLAGSLGGRVIRRHVTAPPAIDPLVPPEEKPDGVEVILTPGPNGGGAGGDSGGTGGQGGSTGGDSGGSGGDSGGDGGGQGGNRGFPDGLPRITAACMQGESIPLHGITTNAHGELTFSEDEADFHRNCERIRLSETENDIKLSARCTADSGAQVDTAISLLWSPAIADMMNHAACSPEPMICSADGPNPLVFPPVTLEQTSRQFSQDGLEAGFPDIGDVLLIRSADGNVVVHARRDLWVADHSKPVITGLFFQIGEDTVEIHVAPHDYLLINGEKPEQIEEVGLPGGGLLVSDGYRNFQITWPDTSFVAEVHVFPSSHLVPSFTPDPEMTYEGLVRFKERWLVDRDESPFTNKASSVHECNCDDDAGGVTGGSGGMGGDDDFDVGGGGTTAGGGSEGTIALPAQLRLLAYSIDGQDRVANQDAPDFYVEVLSQQSTKIVQGVKSGTALENVQLDGDKIAFRIASGDFQGKYLVGGADSFSLTDDANDTAAQFYPRSARWASAGSFASFESVKYPGQFMRHSNYVLKLSPIGADSNKIDMQDASFRFQDLSGGE